jgi:hypothetical protein
MRPADFAPLSRFPQSKKHTSSARQDPTIPLVLAIGGGVAFLGLLVCYVGAAWLIVGLPALAVYLLPTWIAAQRQSAKLLPIAALNLLAGWSIIGWVAALLWALADHRG